MIKINGIMLSEWKQTHSNCWAKCKTPVNNLPLDTVVIYRHDGLLWEAYFLYELGSYMTLYPHKNNSTHNLELAKQQVDAFLERMSKLTVMI